MSINKSDLPISVYMIVRTSRSYSPTNPARRDAWRPESKISRIWGQHDGKRENR